MLAAGQTCSRFVQIIFHLIPKGGHTQRFFQTLVKKFLIAHSVQAQADDDIFANRHCRKRIRFLEHHTNSAANNRRINGFGIEILAVKKDRPFHPRLWHELVHAIESPEKS